MPDPKNTTAPIDSTDAVDKEKKLLEEISEQYSSAEKSHKEIRDGGFTWNQREDLFLGRYKHSKEDTKSILSTGELTTLAIDGACRVMAQLPSGRFYNYNGNTGSNMVMNLVFEHYVMPNANTGGPILLKHRMVDLYSRVYPYIPCFVDWKVTDKYVGPDMIVIHPRRGRPQPGKTAIEDMDWHFIDTEVSKQFLQDKLKADPDGKVWKNVQAVLDSADDEGPGTPTDDRSPDQSNKTKTGITIRHRLNSKGDWQVYAPFTKQDLLLVDVKDYFPGIPMSIKTQYPSLDKLGGINDFDRGEMTQKTIDSSIRMALDGVELSNHPPMVMDPEDVVLSSIVRQPKSKWFVKNGKVDSIKMQNLSPQGFNTFQGFYQILKGNILSLGAQTDTAVASSVDPGFGRTPEALKMQGAKQGSRDAWDTFMMEQFIERTYTIMANMIAKKGLNEIAFKLIGKSIKKIQEEYPGEDYAKLLGPEFLTNGSVQIDPKILEGEYRYIIDEGSTLMKNDDTGQKLMSYVKMYNEFAASKQRFNQGEAFKRALIDDGIKDAEKIIVTEQDPSSVAGVGSAGSTVDPGAAPGAPGEAPAPQGPDLNQMAQAIQQLFGMMQKLQAQPTPVKSPIETINYKDVPEDVKRELEAAAGLTPSQIGTNPVNPNAMPASMPTTPVADSMPLNNQPIIQ